MELVEEKFLLMGPQLLFVRSQLELVHSFSELFLIVPKARNTNFNSVSKQTGFVFGHKGSCYHGHTQLVSDLGFVL